MEAEYSEIIILVGSGRSGTSYLAGLIKTCFDVGIPSEPKFIVPLSKRIHKYGNLAEPQNMLSLIETVLRTPPFVYLYKKKGITVYPNDLIEHIQGNSYTDVLYATFSLLAKLKGRSRLGYKDPYDTVNISALARLFPTARFIHIIRDGRDVASSFLRFPWGPTNIYSAARYWGKSTMIGRRDGKDLPSKYIEIRFEDLIHATQETAWELGRFINGKQNDYQIRNFVEQIELTKNVRNVQVWKSNLDKKQVYLCEAASGPELSDCGYELFYGGSAKLSRIHGAGYIVKDFLFRSLNLIQRHAIAVKS